MRFSHRSSELSDEELMERVPQLIVDGKMVTVPASTLSVVDGTLKTSLSKAEVRKLN